MFHPSPESVYALISTLGYAVILPVAILEGPVIAIIAGFLVSMGTLNWLVTFCVLVLGDILGDLMYYSLGRWVHGPIAERFTRRFRASKRKHELQKMFEKHTTKVLLVNKLHALGSITLYYAGVVRIPLLQYIVINALGSIPKVAFFEFIGYFFGDRILHAQSFLDDLGLLTLLIPIAFIVYYWNFLKKRR